MKQIISGPNRPKKERFEAKKDDVAYKKVAFRRGNLNGFGCSHDFAADFIVNFELFEVPHSEEGNAANRK